MVTPSVDHRRLGMDDVARRLDSIILRSPALGPAFVNALNAVSGNGIRSWRFFPWRSRLAISVPVDLGHTNPGLVEVRRRVREWWRQCRLKRLRRFSLASTALLVVIVITVLALRQNSSRPPYVLS